MVECDLPNDRPVARMPNPSVRTLKAAPTITDDVRNLDIGVPVRSLNCRLQTLHRDFWTTLSSWRLVVPFFTTFWLGPFRQFGQFISTSSTLPLFYFSSFSRPVPASAIVQFLPDRHSLHLKAHKPGHAQQRTGENPERARLPRYLVEEHEIVCSSHDLAMGVISDIGFFQESRYLTAISFQAVAQTLA